MQAARVVSGSLVTDIDMAGALWLLALALLPPHPPPTSSTGFPPPSPTSLLPSIYFLLFSPVSLYSSTLPPSPSPLGLLPSQARRLPPPTLPLSHPPPTPVSSQLGIAGSAKQRTAAARSYTRQN